jgi:hypothetical protein
LRNRRVNGLLEGRAEFQTPEHQGGFSLAVDVCFWHKADITIMLNHVRFRG